MNINNQAKKIVAEIWDNYNLLDANNSGFFAEYHDNMRIQADCSIEVMAEIVEYLKQGKQEDALYYLEQLKTTLTYCKAVINLQKLTNDLPPYIFG